MWYAFIDAQRRLMRLIADSALARSDDQASLAAQDTVPTVASTLLDWLNRSSWSPEHAPSFGIGEVSVDRRRTPIEESVADELPFGVLRCFACRHSRPRTQTARPVLLCAPLAGHHAVILRETVEAIVAGRDVYITDWANARDIETAAGAIGLDDYVLAIERFIIGIATLGAPVHVVAVCQATVPALAAAALLAQHAPAGLASVALLGGPIDARIHPTQLGRFARSHSLQWFRSNVIDTVPAPYRGQGRRVYPGYLQQAAMIFACPERLIGLEARFWTAWFARDRSASDAGLRALSEYSAVLDMSEAYFLDTIRVVFHEQCLARSVWSIGSRHVDTRVLDSIALGTIEGDRDNITGAGQTHCAHLVCRSRDRQPNFRATIVDCDHYDLFTGNRWRETVHPRLCEFWSAAEQTARVARRTPSSRLQLPTLRHA